MRSLYLVGAGLRARPSDRNAAKSVRRQEVEHDLPQLVPVESVVHSVGCNDDLGTGDKTGP